VAITADGKLLATGSYDQTVKLWNLASGLEIAALPGPGDVAFSSDGTMLASGGYASVLTLWDVQTPAVVATVRFNYHLRRLAFTPDGKNTDRGGRGSGDHRP
jgi:WD40 repeat protein